jgi:hypothetical protein
MSDPDGFLARWSRRKREADAAPAPADPAPAEETAAPPLPELPPIETLTAASDFTPFMQPGVPDALRVAALRRLWSIDPAIRDYVGPARDYAWDWHLPGGVPGAGPIESAEEVARLLDRVLGPSGEPADRTLDAAAPASPRPPPALPPSAAATSPGGKPRPEIEAEQPVPAPQKRRHGSATPI